MSDDSRDRAERERETGEPAAPASESPRSEAPTYKDADVFQPGESCGNYTMEGVIARGGMAQIYRAVHRFTRRVAAVKVLLPRYASRKEIVDRMASEARALAEFDEPNIVKIYDAGTDPKAPLYIAMELLEGRDFRFLMNRWGKCDAELALTNLIAIAEAAEGFHEMGIVHRDLKPENVFLTRAKPGQEARIVLLDLGAAKAAKYAMPTTDMDRAIGTGAYMSPEHVMGLPITPASDVYSLCLMGYEMFADHSPFGWDHPGPIGHALYTSWQVHAAPRPLGEVRKDLPEHVCDLFRRGLEKDPAGRFRDMPALVNALRASLRLVQEERARLADPPPLRSRAYDVEEEDEEEEEDGYEEEAPPSDPELSRTRTTQEEASVARRRGSMPETPPPPATLATGDDAIQVARLRLGLQPTEPAPRGQRTSGAGGATPQPGRVGEGRPAMPRQATEPMEGRAGRRAPAHGTEPVDGPPRANAPRQGTEPMDGRSALRPPQESGPPARPVGPRGTLKMDRTAAKAAADAAPPAAGRPRQSTEPMGPPAAAPGAPAAAAPLAQAPGGSPLSSTPPGIEAWFDAPEAAGGTGAARGADPEERRAAVQRPSGATPLGTSSPWAAASGLPHARAMRGAVLLGLTVAVFLTAAVLFLKPRAKGDAAATPAAALPTASARALPGAPEVSGPPGADPGALPLATAAPTVAAPTSPDALPSAPADPAAASAIPAGVDTATPAPAGAPVPPPVAAARAVSTASPASVRQTPRAAPARRSALPGPRVLPEAPAAPAPPPPPVPTVDDLPYRRRP